MKNILFLVLLFAGKGVLAQPVQTLYYSNGKKFLEGHWTFTKRDMLPAAAGLINGLTQTQPNADYPPLGGRADADEVALQPSRWPSTGPVQFLQIVPEGLLTYWSVDKEAYMTITYKAGVPHGPFADYYSPDQPVVKGDMLNGMPDGPWVYYYKSGKPFYTGTYKAYSQAQLEQLWAGNFSGLKGGPPTTAFYSFGHMDRAARLSFRLGGSLQFLDILMGGTQKEGLFTFRRKNGAMWAQVYFDGDVPAGTWKIWKEDQKTPHLILVWEAGAHISAITDSTGRSTTLEAREEELDVWEKARRAAYRPPGAKTVGKTPRSGDINGIDPGMVKPPVTVNPKKRAAPDTPLVYYYVQEMPKFDGDVNAWLAENARFPIATESGTPAKGVVTKFIVQPNGTLTNIELHKGVRPDLDAEALRLIKAMPKWNAGRQNGELVPVHYKLGVRFKL